MLSIKHSSQYSVEDFERYYTGKMPENEMHALEKAAMDDPFLGDALEGYAFAPTPTRDFKDLKERLNKKQGGKIIWYKGKISVQLLKVAAIILFITGVYWVIQNNTNTISDNALASKESLIAADSSNINKTEPFPATDISKAQQNPEPSLKIKLPVSVSSNKAKADSTGIIKNNSSDSYSRSEAEQNTASSERLNNPVANPNKEIRNESVQNIKGRIMNDSGMPVSFAQVVEKGKKNGIIANSSGEFNFPLTNPSSQLIVNAKGYEPVTYSINKNNSIQDIVMQSDEPGLKEPVTNLDTKRRKSNSLTLSAAVPKITVKNAIPLQELERVNYFANDSLQRMYKLISGSSTSIIVGFNINSNNEATNFDFNNTECEICNREAIRLIKLNRWKIINPAIKAEATVIF